MRFLASVAALLVLFANPLFSQTTARSASEHLGSTPAPTPETTPGDILSPADRAAAPASAAPAEISIPLLDDSFKPKPLSAVTESAARHAEWRQLQNRVANDTQLRAAFRAAESAHTDLIKRRLLREYYQLYFSKLLALAVTPETRAYLEARKLETFNSLQQPRVRPTPTPSPTPVPKPVPPPVLILPQPDLPVASPIPAITPSTTAPTP